MVILSYRFRISISLNFMERTFWLNCLYPRCLQLHWNYSLQNYQHAILSHWYYWLQNDDCASVPSSEIRKTEYVQVLYLQIMKYNISFYTRLVGVMHISLFSWSTYKEYCSFDASLFHDMHTRNTVQSLQVFFHDMHTHRVHLEKYIQNTTREKG